MFGKVIVIGLFEMIKKKVRTASLGSGSASGSGWRRGPSHPLCVIDPMVSHRLDCFT